MDTCRDLVLTSIWSASIWSTISRLASDVLVLLSLMTVDSDAHDPFCNRTRVQEHAELFRNSSRTIVYSCLPIKILWLLYPHVPHWAPIPPQSAFSDGRNDNSDEVSACEYLSRCGTGLHSFHGPVRPTASLNSTWPDIYLCITQLMVSEGVLSNAEIRSHRVWSVGVKPRPA